MAGDYAAFVAGKSQAGGLAGFDPVWMPDFLYPFQRFLTEWAVRKGRSALFEDCGLGKTPQLLVWAENVVRHTNRPVLVLTPLAVGSQTVREAEKFGVEAVRSADGKFPGGARVVVANYERLHHFDPASFAGVVCDESSILKNFDGTTKAAVTEFLRTIPYRLLTTATAAPNDYVELGTSSEALGQLGHMDMLGMFFKNDLNNASTGRSWGAAVKWRFKAHAVRDFWRWVCSWARAVRKPSDLGFDDGPFVLPPLLTREHEVKASRPCPGRLFDVAAVTLGEQREEQRRTLTERCERAAQLVSADDAAVCWCHLNDEGDLLEKLIPGAVQVSGKDSDEAKEEKLLAFASGQARVMVTKPKVAGFGLNWQHCAHQTYFPSHSFEQYYQGVRRSWRFGQTRRVSVDLIVTEGGAGVLANLTRKAAAAEAMFSDLVAEMNNELKLNRSTDYTKPAETPAWLSSTKKSRTATRSTTATAAK